MRQRKRGRKWGRVHDGDERHPKEQPPCYRTNQGCHISLDLRFPGVLMKIKGLKSIKCSNFLKGRVLAEYQKSLWPRKTKHNTCHLLWEGCTTQAGATGEGRNSADNKIFLTLFSDVEQELKWLKCTERKKTQDLEAVFHTSLRNSWGDSPETGWGPGCPRSCLRW